MIKAVIFYMDGLILDTEKLLVKYWVQAANEAGFPMKREHALSYEGVTTPDCRTHCNACGANCLVGGKCDV